MRVFPLITSSRAITVLRIVIALFLVAHGIARLSLGTVGGFGSFLSNSGIPGGIAIAWILTIVEILGGVALAIGFFVQPLCAWFIIELIVGMILVHGKNGWFVVGATLNGIEYNVLLVVSLFLIGSSSPKK